MRNVMKATTLESRFPLLSVEHGCIVSKDADITAAFEVELPEVYTVTAEEYEGIHAAWCKAIKVLPDHSVLHKQDWYVKEQYRPDLGREGMGFLARSYEMHFNERPFLHHRCYLFLTKTTKERLRQQSNWNTLCRGHIVPKEIQDKETAVKFIEAVEQFARILNDSGHIKLRRLTDDELVGTDKETGIIGRYFALSLGNADCLEDIEMTARERNVLICYPFKRIIAIFLIIFQYYVLHLRSIYSIAMIMEAKKKKITLQAYDIENEEIGRAYCDLQEQLRKKLSAGEIADTRRMKLNADSPEEDLLSDYALAEQYVFGVMWRISPAKEVPSIPEGLFKNQTIQIGEIRDNEEKVSLVRKDYYYFALNNHFLVTNLPKSRIKSLQTYLNWLLTAFRGNKLYQFTPKVKAPADTRLSEIRNIVFTDPTKKAKKDKPREENAFKVFNFAEDFLKNIVQEIPDLQQLLDKKILSAQLLVKFTKPRKMEEEDYEKLLGAYMKPIGDDEGVTFKLKTGKASKELTYCVPRMLK